MSVQILRLDSSGYVADPVVCQGAIFRAKIEAGKPLTVSFDPAQLLAF